MRSRATPLPAARVVEAASLDARWLAAVPRAGQDAVVHSTFEQVVNLLPADGRLCCLASTSTEDAPRTVRIQAAAWSTLPWRPGDRVRLEPGSIRCSGPHGDVLITLEDAARWRPPVADLGAVTCERLRTALAALAEHGCRTAVASGFEAAAAAALQARVSRLEAALHDGDVADVATAAGELIGLGAGLTPAGDDVLTGLALVAATRGTLLQPVRLALRRALAAHRPLSARTTPVSAAVLEEAVEGRGRQRLHDLLEAIADPSPAPDPTPLTEAIRRVLAIGHSSGADLLVGVRLGVLTELRLRASARAHDAVWVIPPDRQLTREEHR